MPDDLEFSWVYPDGALLANREIEGVTQPQSKRSACYGPGFFICETISQSAARKIAELLGGQLVWKIEQTHVFAKDAIKTRIQSDGETQA